MMRGLWVTLLLFAAFCGLSLWAQEKNTTTNPVRTEIEQDEAWMGEAVKLTITLMSPGPFSGTAVFQVPEIPSVLIVKQGGALVGSETVGGESMMTQRHEFSVYTQLVGAVEIPAFPVEFESKETFVGDPVPRSGMTTTVSFNSKRPPGMEGFPFVVSSATLSVKEAWSPDGQTEFEAGDIVSRSIVREATDVSAMFLSPFAVEPIDGVRVYQGEPEVTDKRDRGAVEAKRVDTIKYQFERGGTFALPEIPVAWWNPKTEKIEEVTLEGITVSVTAPPVPPKPVDKTKVVWTIVGVLAVLVLVKRFVWPFVRKQYAAWHAWRHRPEAVAARGLVCACRRNEAREAYTAVMGWKRAVGMEGEMGGALREPVEELSRCLYGGETMDRGWNGGALLAGFRDEVRRRKRVASRRTNVGALPALNPRVG